VIGSASILTFAMLTALNEFLSTRNHRQFITTKRNEFKRQSKEDKVRLLSDTFARHGLDSRDADSITETIARNENVFEKILISETLGIGPAEDCDQQMLFLESFVMFTSFAFFGWLPLCAYLFVPFLVSESTAVVLSVLQCLVQLAVVGGLRARFTGVPIISSALESLGMGVFIGAFAYMFGAVCLLVLDVEEE